MSIRSRLIWLVLAVLAPTLVFAVLATFLVYQSQWKRVSQSMQETTHAVALAVDRDLARYDAILATMAMSPGLTNGDLSTFHRWASQLARPLWTGIVVYDAEGIPLLDTRRPYGEPLPMPPSLPSIITRSQMDVSPLFTDPVDGSYAFALHRPVLRDGKVINYLGMEFPASRLAATLAEQGMPKRWLGVVMDQRHVVVARTRNPEAYIGERASEDFRKALSERPTGVVESTTLDGEKVLSFFSRAHDSGWTIVIAIPRHELLASALASIGTVLAGILIVLAIAIGLAFAVGRTITRPLALLDEAAKALGRGEPVSAPITGIDETDRTARVLADASQKIHRASADMAEQVAAAVAQAERSHQALLQGQKLEALGRLTGGIAHDFNNLLQSMTVGLQLADMLSTDPRAKRALEACQRSVGRGTQLTRQLMTFSRNRTDESRQLDLRELVLGMSDLLGGALPSRVVLRFDLPEGAWLTVADPLQCELAVLNMALNARDAMPQGGQLVISLTGTTLAAGNRFNLPEGDYIELRVSDTGHGMSAEVAAKAFEPFFTTKAVGEGTGLGLAQVYGFARQSQGMVTLDSRVGEGTRIALLLPRAARVAMPEVAASAQRLPASGQARVLLVDDDAEVRDVVAPMLEALGYQVDVASDAESALGRLEAANEPAIDVLFSDIVMPGRMDGVGLAQTVRERYPGVPILLATGYTERAPAEHGFRVLAKPFDIDLLAGALREAVETRAG
ncbi:response regulator [Stutzerimonas urumqiensis]|uniref:hybrid sensor histidine kinase/response regulator n=1 Tax=Stutzerimonas urumqiensis TaxID=638269 RepID=UPI003BABA1CC